MTFLSDLLSWQAHCKESDLTKVPARDRPKPILLVSAVAETVAETEDTHSAVAEPGAESLVLVSAETVAET